MATNATLLTRRSFSMWLATNGFVFTTSRHALSQDSIESNQVHRVTGKSFEVPGYLDESMSQIEYGRIDHERHVANATVVCTESPLGSEAYGHV